MNEGNVSVPLSSKFTSIILHCTDVWHRRPCHTKLFVFQEQGKGGDYNRIIMLPFCSHIHLFYACYYTFMATLSLCCGNNKRVHLHIWFRVLVSIFISLCWPRIYACVCVCGQNWIAPLQCEPGVTYPYCWTVSMTLAVSHDWGATWKHALPPPHHMVATPPYKYACPCKKLSLTFGCIMVEQFVLRDDIFVLNVKTVRKTTDAHSAKKIEVPRVWISIMLSRYIPSNVTTNAGWGDSGGIVHSPVDGYVVSTWVLLTPSLNPTSTNPF